MPLLFSLIAISNGSKLTDTTIGAQQASVGRHLGTPGPEFELVVARYKENATTMAWLADVPSFYQITIIDKVRPRAPQLPTC